MQKKDGITPQQAETLYKLNYDGWISSCTRINWLWGKCIGNTAHKHYSSYFGTPDIYKVVIINNDTGEIKITDTIERIDYNSNITVDYETMNVKNNINDLTRFLFQIIPFLVPVIITIVVEIFILLFFELVNKRNLKLVSITNLITNLALQFSLIKIDKIPDLNGEHLLIFFIVIEILILIVESLVYYKKLEADNKRKAILYAIVANLISGVFTFWEWIIISRGFFSYFIGITANLL